MTGSNLFRGTLDILILRTAQARPLHGYAIGKTIRDTSSGVLVVEEGVLYPALHRLERRGLLESEWGRTETGRRAKFYRVTGAGAEHLAEEADRWEQYSEAVSAIIAGGGR